MLLIIISTSFSFYLLMVIIGRTNYAGLHEIGTSHLFFGFVVISRPLQGMQWRINLFRGKEGGGGNRTFACVNTHIQNSIEDEYDI